MTCINCGNEVKADERFCPNCGALNLNNSSNRKMDLYKKQNLNKITREKEREVKQEEKIANGKTTGFNLIVFLIINLIIYLLLLLSGLSTTSLLTSKAGLLLKGDYLSYINYGTYAIAVTISYFYTICMELILKKASLPYWGLFIPFYNIYLIFKLAFKDGWNCLIIPIGIAMFVAAPFVLPYSEMIYQILMVSAGLTFALTELLLIGCIGKRFGRSAIITILFSFIVFPTLAFDKRFQYEY